nr:MAG TPA: hypothetical protein [Caudoviricetes sp.]
MSMIAFVSVASLLLILYTAKIQQKFCPKNECSILALLII